MLLLLDANSLFEKWESLHNHRSLHVGAASKQYFVFFLYIIIIIIIIIPNPHFGAVTYIRILNFITSYDMVRDTGLDSKDGFA